MPEPLSLTFRIVVRDGRPWLISPDGVEEPDRDMKLVPLGEDLFRIAPTRACPNGCGSPRPATATLSPSTATTAAIPAYRWARTRALFDLVGQHSRSRAKVVVAVCVALPGLWRTSAKPPPVMRRR